MMIRAAEQTYNLMEQIESDTLPENEFKSTQIKLELLIEKYAHKLYADDYDSDESEAFSLAL